MASRTKAPAKAAPAEEKVAKVTGPRFDPFSNPGETAKQEAAWLNEKFSEFGNLGIKPSHVRALLSGHAEFQKSPERQAAREQEKLAKAAEAEARAEAVEAKKQERAEAAEAAEAAKAERAEAKEAARVAKEEAAAARKEAAAAKKKPATKAVEELLPAAKPAPKKRVAKRRPARAATPDPEEF